MIKEQETDTVYTLMFHRRCSHQISQQLWHLFDQIQEHIWNCRIFVFFGQWNNRNCEYWKFHFFICERINHFHMKLINEGYKSGLPVSHRGLPTKYFGTSIKMGNNPKPATTSYYHPIRSKLTSNEPQPDHNNPKPPKVFKVNIRFISIFISYIFFICQFI